MGVRADADERLDLRSKNVLPLHVSRTSLPRALRLLEGIGREAERRGWQLRADPPAAGYGRTRAVIGRRSASLSFLLFEETDKTRIPKYDHTMSGRLRLKLDGYGRKRASFGDGVRQQLEDLLPEMFAIIEQDFDNQDAAEQARQLAEQERQRQRELDRERAYLQVKYDHKATAARDQVQRWRAATLLRDYATAISQQQADPAAREWADWILAHADEVDPMLSVIAAPEGREPTWSEMARYLPAGWY